MNYYQEACALLKNLNQRMGPSAYDIPWLVRLQNRHGYGHDWPDLVMWLLATQHENGSWGGQIAYYHDRIICTLSTLIALAECQPRHHVIQSAIKRGEHYLWHHLHWLPHDPSELVGFELLFPTLLAEARALGLNVPQSAYGYERVQAQKLALIPEDMLYAPNLSIAHSLEFLGSMVNKQQLSRAVATNGSLGNSPSATAYYLLQTSYAKLDDAMPKRALTYLETVWQHMNHIVYLYPFALFELTWVLNNFTFCHTPIVQFADRSVWQTLLSEMGQQGIGLDRAFGAVDGDITAVTHYLLAQAGHTISSASLAGFEDEETHLFRTYRYERNMSVGTNIHALRTLQLLPEYPCREQATQEILAYLAKVQIVDLYWVDKWHASPYYATSHILITLLEQEVDVNFPYHKTVEWFLNTQRGDGSWGFFDKGTLEETAYVIITLLHYYARYQSVDSDVLHKGAAYLANGYAGGNSTYPELWIGKCLYAPYDIIRSSILTALILYQEIFGRAP